MIRLPPISTRTDTLVPSATLFRSVLNTPAPPLQRNQYRFFLPTVAFAGTSSEWINDDRKLLLQGAFGRAGIYTGTRVVGFDVADGDVGSLGAQWRWAPQWAGAASFRSEEHTSELQSLMRISYAVFCLKKKTKKT